MNAADEQHPAVMKVLEVVHHQVLIIQQQVKTIEDLKAEIAQLKEEDAWQSHLDALGLRTPRHRQIATEGALLGSVLFHGVPNSLVIVSDDAGQFNILAHALCWVHGERTIEKIIPYGEDQRQAIETTLTQIWQLYEDLKAYKLYPEVSQKAELEARFDTALFI